MDNTIVGAKIHYPMFRQENLKTSVLYRISIYKITLQIFPFLDSETFPDLSGPYGNPLGLYCRCSGSEIIPASFSKGFPFPGRFFFSQGKERYKITALSQMKATVDQKNTDAQKKNIFL